MGTNVSDNIQRTGITTGNSECVIYLDKKVLNLTIDEYITLKDMSNMSLSIQGIGLFLVLLIQLFIKKGKK